MERDLSVSENGAKLNRQSTGYQRLYLLCYLQQRWQKAQERIADGLVHHLRQAKGKARQYTQESVSRDWRKAEKNVNKAAEVLHLFIDDAINEQQSFAAVRQSALDIISRSELESMCLFLNDQRRSVDEATWQYNEKRDGLCVGLIRELFLCLRFAGHQGSERLAQLLRQAQADFSTQGELSQLEYYKRHLPKRHRSFLQDRDGDLKQTRYEWYLYLKIPSRLNGKLTLPDLAKSRALEADLVSSERWKNSKDALIAQTLLPKVASEPDALVQEMEQALESRLQDVSDYLEKSDNRNVVLINPKGKGS